MSKVKLTANACNFLLTEFQELPESLEMEASDFIALVAFEKQLTSHIETAREAIKKTGFTEEDSEFASAYTKDNSVELSDEDAARLARFKQVEDISATEVEIDKLPSTFKLPGKATVKLLKLIYSLKEE